MSLPGGPPVWLQPCSHQVGAPKKAGELETEADARGSGLRRLLPPSLTEACSPKDSPGDFSPMGFSSRKLNWSLTTRP